MRTYFYIDSNGNKLGPYSGQQLKELAARGVITPDTPMETESGQKGLAGQIRGLFVASPAKTTFFYIDQNGQKQGPCSEQELKTLAAQGVITPDTPLETNTAQKRLGGEVTWLFPTKPDGSNDDVTSTINKLNTHFRLFAKYTATWLCCCPAYIFVSLIVVGDRSPMAGDGVLVVTLVVLILFLIFMFAVLAGPLHSFFLLYRLWSVIPKDIARTTPGKAVGFSFIPIFNFYWWFVAFWGLAKDMNKALRQRGIQYRVNENIGLLCCILMPLTAFWIQIGLIDFFNSVRNGAIALLEHENAIPASVPQRVPRLITNTIIVVVLLVLFVFPIGLVLISQQKVKQTQSTVAEQADKTSLPVQTVAPMKALDNFLDVPPLKTYRDDEYGFSFHYPKDWRALVRPKDAPSMLVLAAGQIDGNIAPFVNVTAETLDNDISNENLLEIPEEVFQTILESHGLNNVEIKDFGVKEIGGKESLFCHYQATTGEEGFPIEALQFMYIQKDKEFEIKAMDSQANFGKNRSAFDSIISSFQFD